MELFKIDEKNLLSGERAMYPKFAFSDELNTCLYKVTIFSRDNTGSSIRAYIKDVYTNDELASYWSFNIKGKEPNTHGDKIEYDDMENKYFSK
jgi:hypothetical protein